MASLKSSHKEEHQKPAKDETVEQQLKLELEDAILEIEELHDEISSLKKKIEF